LALVVSVAGVADGPDTFSQVPPLVVAAAVVNVTDEIAPGAVTMNVWLAGFTPFAAPENVIPGVLTTSVAPAVTVRVTGTVI
jgi:hypothetical protein